jgi:hypothetical protein
VLTVELRAITAIVVKFLSDKHKLYAWALTLALITLYYNIIEGLVSASFSNSQSSCLSPTRVGLQAYTGISGLDSIGACIIGVICYRERKEAFTKARNASFACACRGKCTSRDLYKD